MNAIQAELKLRRSLGETVLMDYDIFLNVKRYFTDVNGTKIAKNTVPVALRTKYPFFMLGAFDILGGFSKGLQAVQPMEGTFYLTSFVQGFSGNTFQITGFSGVDDIKNNIKNGDIVHVYTDNLTAPTYFIWIVQNSNSQAVGSIIGNTRTAQKDDIYNRMWIDRVNYIIGNNNIRQYEEQIFEIKFNNLGLTRNDTYSPNIERTPDIFLNDIVILPFKFKLDQYIEFGTYFQFNSEDLQFIYHIKK